MADQDSDTQDYFSGIYEALTKTGFKGKQTPGIPYHISLSTYSPDKEDEAEVIHEAMPVVINSFRTVIAKITKLHLYEFWPTREIAVMELKG